MTLFRKENVFQVPSSQLNKFLALQFVFIQKDECIPCSCQLCLLNLKFRGHQLRFSHFKNILIDVLLNLFSLWNFMCFMSLKDLGTIS